MQRFMQRHVAIASMEEERDSLRKQEQFYRDNERLVNSHIVARRHKRATLVGYAILFFVEAWVGLEIASLITANNARHLQSAPVEQQETTL